MLQTLRIGIDWRTNVIRSTTVQVTDIASGGTTLSGRILTSNGHSQGFFGMIQHMLKSHNRIKPCHIEPRLLLG
ncbi:MAG: hypothetical protein HYR79_05960 [Nitrospirae bacterium]|nr:hypothetical protein [Nitrospirota bacterium]